MKLDNIFNLKKNIENDKSSNFIEHFIKDLTNYINTLEKTKDIYYIVDKFENNFAICENYLTKEFTKIPKKQLDENVKEGDLIKLENESYKTDIQKTLERKNLINQKFNSLLK